MDRYIHQYVIKDLKKKMVFITGPRQVGKTFFARSLEKEFKKPAYLNYDDHEQALIINKRQWPLDTGLLILDEIHKMKNWKKFIKGVYDTKPAGLSILVTGSSRLDTFRQSGESLAGRYFQYRLNPFSVKELAGRAEAYEALKKLNTLGGFPEPFLSGSEEEAARWRKQYFSGVIREDILDFSRIHEIKILQLLIEMLRARTGVPLSYLSISRDLQISPHTVKNYIDLLESLYIIFLVRPFHRNVARSVTKEPKLYFYDSGFVNGDEGKKFENTVAVALLKHAQFLEDTRGEDIELSYARTKDGREVDFVLSIGGKAAAVIEAKLSETETSKHLKHFGNMFKGAELLQIVQNMRTERETEGVKVVRAAEWLSRLSA